jgi:hypothetical protein
MADGDSSNGNGVGSADHAMKLASVWPSEDSLQGLQDGLRDLKERSLQSLRKTAAEMDSRLNIGNEKSLAEIFRWPEIKEQAGRAWQSGDPWIKWPIATL